MIVLSPDNATLVVKAPGITVVQSPTPSTTAVVVLAKGPKGDPGAPTGAPLIFRQATPAATWTITHLLGWRPELLLFLDDAPDEQVFTDVTYPDDYTVVIELPEPASGTVYLR